MAASMQMTVFRHVAPCSLVEIYQRFIGACCVLYCRSDDGGSKYL
jgi:hypothetical protein